MINTWEKTQKEAFNAAAAIPAASLQALRAEIDLLVATGASLNEAKAMLDPVISGLSF